MAMIRGALCSAGKGTAGRNRQKEFEN